MSEEASLGEDGGDHGHGAHDKYDLETLRALLSDLEGTADSLIEYGENKEIPAIEHNAQRIRDSTRVLAQNVPRVDESKRGKETRTGEDGTMNEDPNESE